MIAPISPLYFENSKDATNDSIAVGAVSSSNTNVIDAEAYVYNK